MAPNLDSPTGTTKSTDQQSQLSYIEQTLRRLEQNTLRIKKKNEKIISSFDRRNPTSSSRSNEGGGQSSRWEVNSFKDSKQPNEAPPKPPRRPPQPKPRLLRPEVSQALLESADVRQKMHDTLKACAEDRERHRKSLEQMRLEGQQLLTVRPVLSCATSNPTLSVLSKTKDVFRGILKKLSYSDSNSTNGYKINSSRNEEPKEVLSLSPKTNCLEQICKNADGNQVGLNDDRENTNYQSFVKPILTPPKPKPRNLKVPNVEFNPIENPSEDSKDVVNPTLDDLRRICQLATDDESTLPRLSNESAAHRDNFVAKDFGNEETDYSSSSSESDFGEYIQAPLVVKTVTASTDSDESLLGNFLPIKSGFSKNRKSIQVPKPYRKSSMEEVQELKPNLQEVSNRQKLGILRKKLSRPPSPPPRKLVRTPSLKSELPNLIEEQPSTWTPISPYMDSLVVSSPSMLQSPPSSSLQKFVDCLEVSNPLQFVVPHQHQISALCPGVPIHSIDISLTPWKNPETSTYKSFKPNFGQNILISSSGDLQEAKIEDRDDDIMIQNTINADFGFLSDIEDLFDEEIYAAVPTPNTNDIQTNVTQEVQQAQSISNLEKSVKIELSTDIGPQISKDLLVTGISANNDIIGDVVIPDTLNSSNVDTTKITDFPSEIWNEPMNSVVEIFHQVSKSSRFHELLAVESDMESLTTEELFSKQLMLPSTELLPTEVSVETMIETQDHKSCQQLPEGNLEPPKLPTNAPPTPSTKSSVPIFLEQESACSTSNSASGPPPPPPMPSVPIFLESSISKKKTWVNLPITPLENTLSTSGHCTIFDTIRPIGDTTEFHLDMKFIEDNFMKDGVSTLGSSQTSFINLPMDKVAADLSSQSGVSLLTHNRRTVIIIGTKKLKPSTENILTALKSLNVDELSVDDIQILLQILPKENEKTLYEDKKYETLCEEDRLMKSLSEIPRVSEKLEAMNYIMNFEETIASLESAINLLQSAAQSVRNSDKFPKIIQAVLFVINKAFVKDAEPLKGFEINSLQRLASRKSADGKVSLLHCIINCLETTFPETINFFNDFSGIEEASKVSKSDVSNVLKELKNDHQNLREEISEIELQDIKTVDGFAKAKDFFKKSSQQISNIKQRWENTMEEVKNIAGYFGMSETQSLDIRDFFLIILGFVNDYKKALAENEKLFKKCSDIKQERRSSISSSGSRNSLNDHQPMVKLRNPKQEADNNTSSTVDPHRRRSLRHTQITLQELEKESGQPQEFIDAVAQIGELHRDARQRRRTSFYGSKPIRKSYGLNEDTNRER